MLAGVLRLPNHHPQPQVETIELRQIFLKSDRAVPFGKSFESFFFTAQKSSSAVCNHKTSGCNL